MPSLHSATVTVVTEGARQGFVPGWDPRYLRCLFPSAAPAQDAAARERLQRLGAVPAVLTPLNVFGELSWVKQAPASIRGSDF